MQRSEPREEEKAEPWQMVIGSPHLHATGAIGAGEELPGTVSPPSEDIKAPVSQA